MHGSSGVAERANACGYVLDLVGDLPEDEMMEDEIVEDEVVIRPVCTQV